jgi:phospholipase/carboxylesterase
MSHHDRATIRLEPASGPARQLFILLHGVGASAGDLLPLGHVLHRHFPQSAVVLPEGTERFAAGGPGRQWFSVQGVTEANRPARVAQALPALEVLVRREQKHYGVAPADSVLAGFSQGAIMALELAAAHDGLVGRVLSFSGRFAALPAVAPRDTNLHFLHGARDPVMPVRHAKEGQAFIEAQGGTATLDIDTDAGHDLPAHLMERAVAHLRQARPATAACDG